MKTLQQIQDIIADELNYLEQEYKVKKIGVFNPSGSDEATFEGQVNILVEINNPQGWEYIDLHDHLESELDMHVNIIATRMLQPQEKEKMQSETRYI